jgi:Glycosyl hydrolase family 99
MHFSRQALSTFVRKVVVLVLFMVVLIVGVRSNSSNTYAQSYGHRIVPSTIDPNRPVVAFYYMWYHKSDWCSCHMPDLPTIQYNSANGSTIDRQLNWAANAGLTGFISSWWGIGDQTDTNFGKLLAHSATLEQNTGYHFASTIYFESDSPNLQGQTTMVNALNYIVSHYTNDPHFLRWHGKPVLFIWNPLGNGRTLSLWSSIRHQVDPNNQMYWSAEGVDMSLLDVFDGIHLYSAGYWGLLNGDMQAVDQGFRNEVNAYNAAHHTQKIWAAGVMPGYNDTLIPGRQNPFIVPRNNGATYHTSWDAAIASSPDWITISTFNEWYEGSMIEPSVTYNTQYLTITQQYDQQWHGK